MYTEIIKIIDGGIKGDKQKVYNYAKVLAYNLKSDGDVKFAKKIENTLSNRPENITTLDEFSSKPVDQESRLDMVNIYFPSSNKKELFFNKYIEEEINGFIQCFFNKEKLEKMGVDNEFSLLLYGAPGCGKTSIAEYISDRINIPIVVARLDGLVSSLLGNTAKNIRKIFEYASRRQCILFLDEFDAIAKIRDDKNELGELKRVVNSLIQNIDEFSKDNILIAATNHENMLDKAVWRRFSQVMHIDKPGKIEIKKILLKNIGETKTDFIEKNKKIDIVINEMEGLSPSDINHICNSCIRKMIIKNQSVLKFVDLLAEVYLLKNHEIKNEDEFIQYLINHCISQRDINELYNFSWRTIRKISKKEV